MQKVAIFTKVYCVLILLFSQGCVFPSDGTLLDGRDADLYDRIGFPVGNRPVDISTNNRNAKLANQGMKVVDDYYYRTPEPKRPLVKSRPQKRVLRVRYRPSSRYYNNPYSFKPPAQFPYFDSDQYYIPPRAGDNSENQSVNNNKLY